MPERSVVLRVGVESARRCEMRDRANDITSHVSSSTFQ